MGFYGKIYEQAVNIFNRLRFKNNYSTVFPSSTAESFDVVSDGGYAAD